MSKLSKEQKDILGNFCLKTAHSIFQIIQDEVIDAVDNAKHDAPYAMIQAEINSVISSFLIAQYIEILQNADVSKMEIENIVKNTIKTAYIFHGHIEKEGSKHKLQ